VKFDSSGMGFGDAPVDYTYYRSSVESLNQALGGGIRGGLLVQLLADPGHGKTTLALDFIAQAQPTAATIEVTVGKSTRQVNALFVDLERTFDPAYAAAIGVDTSKLVVYKPSIVEQALPQIEGLLRQGLQIVVFDSVPAMVTKDEFDKEISDPERMAGSAGLLSRWLRRLVGLVDTAQALFIFVNQYRANISPMARTMKKPYGPYSLRYSSGIIIELVRLKTEDQLTTVQATVTKSKQGVTGNRTEYMMRQGKGLAADLDLLSLALEAGIIKKAGSWYEYNGTKAQGLSAAAELFDLADIRSKVIGGQQ
jgi:recombination protein RecA